MLNINATPFVPRWRYLDPFINGTNHSENDELCSTAAINYPAMIPRIGAGECYYPLGLSVIDDHTQAPQTSWTPLAAPPPVQWWTSCQSGLLHPQPERITPNLVQKMMQWCMRRQQEHKKKNNSGVGNPWWKI